MIDPIRLSFTLACSAEHAFDTWTLRATSWWPAEHTVSHEPDARIVFEPHVGGRIYERTARGTEIEWGQIIEWERPRRLRYLWHIATDPVNATDVAIVFRLMSDASTRIEIEHGGWDRLGDLGRAWRNANHAGWDGTLPAFQNAIRVNLHSRPGG